MAKRVKFDATSFNFGANVARSHGRRVKGKKSKAHKGRRGGKGGAFGS